MAATGSALLIAAAAAGTGCFAGVLAGASLMLLQQYSGRQPSGQRRRHARRHGREGTQGATEQSSSEDVIAVQAYTTLRDSKRLQTSASTRELPPAAEQPMEAGWQGFSMEEARNLADATHREVAAKTPQDVLADLQKGNMRFWTGTARRPEKSAFERRALISKQFPLVATLGCSDSRVPTEIIFDVGLGDIFVSRVAGNCLDTATLASLQYAVHHLKVKVLMVLGHEGCGAVKAAGLSPADINKEPQALGRLLNSLKGGLEHKRLEGIHDGRAYDREAVVTNVRRQIEQLAGDDGIMAKVVSGELLVVGAFYEISSGIVDFFSEVTVSSPPYSARASAPTLLTAAAAARHQNNDIQKESHVLKMAKNGAK
eukprot:TRINITY_DN10239_c0_g1_i1.p1 TRINITY_DN10239_c0_g1~~TRINITY_DN10239_c0_g1_i1.p1  ORF type:complete len:393 (+),score=103.17 TRINITY_DN10239_c0_g1_i1:67-1179(+)